MFVYVRLKQDKKTLFSLCYIYIYIYIYIFHIKQKHEKRMICIDKQGTRMYSRDTRAVLAPYSRRTRAVLAPYSYRRV